MFILCRYISSDSKTTNFREYLKAESLDKKKKEFDLSGWQFVHAKVRWPFIVYVVLPGVLLYSSFIAK